MQIDGRDLHLAVRFLLRGLDDPATLRPYGTGAQDLAFVARREELNWLEPYHRRFPDPTTARWLRQLRPLSHAWTGGPASLYFAGLGTTRPDRPSQALLSAGD